MGNVNLFGIVVTPIQAFTTLWFIFFASAFEIILRVKKVKQIVNKLDKSDIEKAFSTMQSHASIFMDISTL